MVHLLIREQHVAAPLRDVFDYFATPLNLDAATPDSLRIEVLSSPPYTLSVGSVYDYVMRLRGIPLRWTSRITRFEPPYRFTYVQVRGPYAFWEHDHVYSERDGVTTIRDEVRYTLPLGWLGRMAHRLAVRRELDHVFDQRARLIASHFAEESSETSIGCARSGGDVEESTTSSGGFVRP